VNLFTIALCSFLAVGSVVLTVVMLSLVAQTSPKARIRNRLNAIAGNPTLTDSEIQGILKNTELSAIPWFNQLLTQMRLNSIHTLLERANLNLSVGRLLLLCVFIGTVVATVLVSSGESVLVSFTVGLLGASTPYLYLRYLAKKRLRVFLEQLPAGLDIMSRGLEAGLGLTQAIVTIGREMPDPIGTEFSIFVEELNLGLPLTEALRKFQSRIPLQEARMMSTAMIVQREVGGSLAELLGKLADMVRDRFRIERQIKTLTAQNRMSAWVVSSLPVMIGLGMLWTDPEGFQKTMAQPVGQVMLMAAVLLEVFGILAFCKLIQIRI